MNKAGMEINQAPKEMTATRITMAEISEVKRQFIRANLLLTFEEAGAILGKSARTVQELVKDQKLVAADEKAIKPGRKGATATVGTRVTAESVEAYRCAILIPTTKWSE